ncbi:MAG: bifunctional (p)ppGpp synthetase/guanosine-3',5'-bis(diphosphate) 3'-pyrophosphohydrolase [Dehalococcoidia bacterium]
MPAAALLETVKSYLPPDRVQFVQSALDHATQAHSQQRRQSGEPYIEHPLATAEHLAAMHLDSTTIAAALLHDVMEDCGVQFKELEDRYGRDVARLVDGVTKLKRMDLLASDDEADTSQPLPEAARAASLRKMLVAMAEDVRVVLIKLADRLHNMRTLQYLPADRQQRIARETLDIYAPLAHRLGMADIKWKLEDEAFRYLMPKEYKAISRLINRKRAEREAYTQRAISSLQEALGEVGVNTTVNGRPKHLFSTYNKMLRYEAQGRKFDEIYDLIALRVIVDSVSACYEALGVVHGMWRPVPGEFDDYIASPKENLYQSLHTSVICHEGYPVEVQIRTKEMHRLAEDGVAAHWAYKEGDHGNPGNDQFEQKLSWLKQLLEWQREMAGDQEYLDSVKTDILKDQVFVYTPAGDVKDLPAGSTPLDFAYRIHTELGHNCVGAMVNGKLVPLNTQLRNGDTVEIRKSRMARGPSLDWLNPNLGYLATAGATAKVRAWFRKQERGANVQRGRDQLRKELRRHGITDTDADIAEMMGFDSVDDLAEALGTGHLGTAQIAEKLGQRRREAMPVKQHAAPPPLENGINGSGIVVMGAQDLLTRVPRCCSPVYGDEIVGYLTRGRGVTVHRRSCPNLRGTDEPDRLVPVAWGHADSMYPARLVLDAVDRVGLLRDITNVVSAEHVNIHSMTSEEEPHTDSCTVSLTVYTTGVEQLSRLFARIEAIPGVRNVSRASQAEHGVRP